jgi:hypothetical protein
MFSVTAEKLMQKGGAHTVNTASKTDRIPTEIELTPDGRFLLGTNFI